ALERDLALEFARQDDFRAQRVARNHALGHQRGEIDIARLHPFQVRKPHFGSRRYSGIWPPSKPTLWKPPARAFWPLCPRLAVLPQPEPMPRPSRWRSCLAPGAGFSPLSRILVLQP